MAAGGNRRRNFDDKARHFPRSVIAPGHGGLFYLTVCACYRSLPNLDQNVKRSSSLMAKLKEIKVEITKATFQVQGEMIMDFPSRKSKESSDSRRSRLLWPALVFFFVGSAICSFNPPANNGQQVVEGEQAMNSRSEGHEKERTDLKGGLAPSQIETATFALG